MIILSRTLFIIAILGFASAVFFWNDLLGVILWRVSLALAVIAIGIQVLWGRFTEEPKGCVDKEDLSQPMQVLALVMSVIQLLLIVYAFAPFYFAIGSGIAFIYIMPVAGLGFFLTSLIWLSLSRYYKINFIDQLIPYMAVVIFALSASLSAEAILYAQVFAVTLGILSVFMVYKNALCLKKKSYPPSV